MTAHRVARALGLLSVLSTTACTDRCTAAALAEVLEDVETRERVPFVDEWEVVWTTPAAGITLLSVGDRVASDNFANRGDIEVRHVEDSDEIVVEMQRFTVAEDEDEAADHFARMSPWLYDLPVPEPPDADIEARSCALAQSGACYVRAYYDGLFQPSRDGANFRVTLPLGWQGELLLTTSDNLEHGDDYPDRSDLSVDDLAGDLTVDMDGGRLSVRLDPELPHYAGCDVSEVCEAGGHDPACGCSEPTRIVAETRSGEAANMVLDLGDASGWYSVLLENRALGSNCAASLDCGPFASCELDPDFEGTPSVLAAELNYPGVPALRGAGVEVTLVSDGCRVVDFVEGPEDFGREDLASELRGDVQVCLGCL